MRVILVGSTVFHMAAADAGYVPHAAMPGLSPDDDWPSCSDELAEFGGRLCYKSWARPNPATATNASYLKSIIEKAHFSVLGHASASFYIDGVSRSFTHELVRHKWFTYSQVSQRYSDESAAAFVVPPDLRDEEGGQVLDGAREAILPFYRRIFERQIARGRSRKEARQAARSVLPNATETAILVTGNMWAWRGMIAQRTATDHEGKPLADLEYFEVATELLRQLKEIAPNSFQDM